MTNLRPYQLEALKLLGTGRIGYLSDEFLRPSRAVERHQVPISPVMYDALEREGVDMGNYVRNAPIPVMSFVGGKSFVYARANNYLRQSYAAELSRIESLKAYEKAGARIIGDSVIFDEAHMVDADFSEIEERLAAHNPYSVFEDEWAVNRYGKRTRREIKQLDFGAAYGHIARVYPDTSEEEVIMALKKKPAKKIRPILAARRLWLLGSTALPVVQAHLSLVEHG